MSRNFALSSCLCAVLLATGCGQADPRPSRVPVTGAVFYKNQPVQGALVVFSPAGPGRPAASATTDGEGKFQLRTFEDGDGAVPGEYKVAVSKKTATNSIPEAEMEAYMIRTGNSPPPPKIDYLVPAKYDLPATSDIKASVSASAVNDIRIELKDEAG